MKKLLALLTGVTFLFGAVGMSLAAEKKDNATQNATKKETPKKKKVEGC
ncbi:MAG: hypothetical protein ACP5IN_01775 [Caldimicrobium sp.]|jgi:CHASE3 domain sensor protein